MKKKKRRSLNDEIDNINRIRPMGQSWDEAVEGMKFCGRCQREFPANGDFFDADQTKPDGLKGWCKPCRKERRELKKAKQAAELLETLDKAMLANVAASRPGGAAMPHAAELYQDVMAMFGGSRGYAMHLGATFIAAAPGSQTRQRILADVMKLGQNVSDDKKIDMPTELLSDEDLEKRLAENEKRLTIHREHSKSDEHAA